MEHIRLVQILAGAKQVVDDGLYVFHLQVDVRLDDLLEVAFSMLHDDIERVKVVGVGRVQDFDKFDDEGMSNFVHKRNLSQNALAISFILEDVFHTLDGDFSTSRLLRSESYLAIATRTEKLCALVLVSNLPVCKLRLLG